MTETAAPVEIKRVETRKQQREFVNFPVNLYKGNEYFVPGIYSEELAIFKEKHTYYEVADHIFFNAYRDGKMVGRIQGIIQHAGNEKRNEKRVRFTRFDSIDDQEVATALFSAVENWGRENGMDTICGPLGYSDFEREGLLIEGFDQMSTYAEQYNYDYYQRLIENQGYEKEVDWVEFKVKLKEDDKTDYGSMVETLMKRNKLHFAEFKNTSDFVDKYVDDFFNLADETYSQLYGTVPFNAAPYAKKRLADSVKTVVNKRYIGVILDENNRAASFGLTFCSFADAVKKSNGHLTPLCLYRMFRDIKHPKRIEFGLVGVRPEYRSRGAGAIAVYQIAHLMKVDNIEYADTNLNLEDNNAIINIWRHFDSTQNKRRRAFVKKL